MRDNNKDIAALLTYVIGGTIGTITVVAVLYLIGTVLGIAIGAALF